MLEKQVLRIALFLAAVGPACSGSGESPACLCGPPQAPALTVIHAGAILEFDPLGGLDLVIGTSRDLQAPEPDEWLAGDRVTLESGTIKVFARAQNPNCPEGQREQVFSQVYRIRDCYPPPPGKAQSTAIAMDDPRITSWAAGFESPVAYGESVLDQFRTPELALGPATGIATDVVSLGRGGEIVLRLDPPAADGQGDDLAVFENGINDSFLELAFVEVSSDGDTFVRFDSASLTDQPVEAFGSLDTTRVGGLAGKYRKGYGTPFDLANLQNRPEVRSGLLDLDHIRYLKVVDVVGDGHTLDGFRHPIYDPYPTVDSAGFDLEAVGVLHAAGSR